MVQLPFSRRLLLRCDMSYDGAQSICHTVQVSENSAFIWTNRKVPVDTEVTMRLSFPGLLDQLDLAAVVQERYDAVDPGDPEGLLVDFKPEQRGARALGQFLSDIDHALKSQREVDAGGYQLLFVEDSDLLCQMFKLGARKYFRNSPVKIDIDVAQDCEEAWRLVESRPYDMAVVDFFLPGQLGSELVRKIRDRPELAGTTCVGVSVGGDEAREAFLQAGADMYLDKPMVLQDLFATLEVLSAHRTAKATGT